MPAVPSSSVRATIEQRQAAAYDPENSQGGEMRAMKLAKIAGALALFLVCGAPIASFGQAAPDNPQLKSQEQGAAATPPAGQGEENDSTLELAPQPGSVPMKPGVQEIPGERSFRPGEDTASIPPDLGSGDSSRPRRRGRPYLGVEVQYTMRCFLGKEERGLQIVKVDPNSPAWAAGLRGPQPATAVGASGVTLGTLIPFANPLINHFLEKSGSLGLDGDLIVAVDDQRVRTQDDLEEKMAQMKPGDTMYLTVIRPMPGGEHKTLKIPVKLGEWGQPLAKANTPPPDGSAQ
jgi:hypothetical protein